MYACVVCDSVEEAGRLMPVLADKLNLMVLWPEARPTRYLRITSTEIWYGNGMAGLRKLYTKDLPRGVIG